MRLQGGKKTESLDLIGDRRPISSIAWTPTGVGMRAGAYLSANPVTRIGIMVLLFGGGVVFGIYRFVSLNLGSHRPAPWIDLGAILAGLAAVGVIGAVAFTGARGTLRGGGKGRRFAKLLVVVLVVAPATVALPRRSGSGYAFSPSVQVIGDATIVATCLMIMVVIMERTMKGGGVGTAKIVGTPTAGPRDGRSTFGQRG